MKRLLYGLFLITLLLTSCSDDSTVKNNRENKQETSRQPSVTQAAAEGELNLDKLDISSATFEDVNTGRIAGYSNKKFIGEFISFIFNQAYSKATEEWDRTGTAKLLDKSGGTLLEITLGSKNVSFDRNVGIRGNLYEKGIVYETGEWLYEYMGRFMDGNVLNPVLLSFPAKVGIPAEFQVEEILNRGNPVINLYETIAGFNYFISESFAGREFEITGGERLYNEEAVRTEAAKQGRARVLCINCVSGEQFMNITSSNKYSEFVRAYSLSLYKDDGAPDIYRLAGDGEVLLIKVDEAFDRAFQELFDNDVKIRVSLTASDVEELFKQKNPWFTDYICKNLGMKMWNHREDDILEKSRIRLTGGKQYTLLNILNPYDSRLLFFNTKTGAFIDYIDYGGRQAGTGFKTEKAGDFSWIVGDRCLGHGTGESIYNREWYTLDDNGKKLALSIPYNTYSVGPYGGSIFKADDIRLVNGSPVRLKVDYDLTRVYMLDIDGADEYGQVNVKTKKAVEFIWDATVGRFTSGYAADEQGVTYIMPESTGITEKCGAILEKNFNRLQTGIKALDTLENELERSHKTGSYEEFLRDCPESDKKAALLKLLSEKSLAS